MSRNLMQILTEAKAERERLLRNSFVGPQPEPECEECGHKMRLHDAKEGCTFERGDAWVDGERMGARMAQGPCGCTSVTVEPAEDTECDYNLDRMKEAEGGDEL